MSREWDGGVTLPAFGRLPGGTEDALSRFGGTMGRRWLGWGLGLGAFAAVVVGVRALPVAAWLGELAETVRGLGPAGVAAYGVACVVAGILTVPAAPLAIAGGWAFGPVVGTLVTVAANTFASAIAFWVGRLLFRDPERFATGEGIVARAVRAAGSGGFKLVLLLRLSPVTPFAALNYAFGATKMRARDFSAATFVGSLPGTAACAAAGSLLGGPLVSLEGGTPWPLLAAGLAALLIGSAGFLRRWLAEELPAVAAELPAEADEA
jgi:uncharacterized membrane protein YdjX (TVP38/TMEM64 family)